jgi:2-dehydro-3-deoxygalactonokinase
VTLCRGDEVLFGARAQVGARDTARDGSPARLAGEVAALLRRAREAVPAGAPLQAVAAGMITSPQGLCEVPHVPAPADAAALARGARQAALPGAPDLPIVYVPGVRCGPDRCDPTSVDAVDIMRGEEVLALGLAALGPLAGGGRLLNLGSHWKAIAVDARGAVTASVTTLGGELAHAVQTQTILASALPAERPTALAPAWLAAGGALAGRAGLARALFCTRLLEQRAEGTADERYAFFLGALCAADRPVLVPDGAPGRTVVVGHPAVTGAWLAALHAAGLPAEAVDEATVERAFRAGCRAVLVARGPGQREARP